MSHHYDVIVIGGGAAGMMCAAQAGQRGRSVLLIDHSKKVAEKIRISGGGRCNFTNLNIHPERFLSQNPHFCKSALQQYTQHDFIDLVNSYDISWHEKKLGQLFCDESAQQIIDMLLTECDKGKVVQKRSISVSDISKTDDCYEVTTEDGKVYDCTSLVIATGGLSIPKIGATKFAYQVAEQFGLKIIPPRAALVPLIFQNEMKDYCTELSGLSVEANVTAGKQGFSEGMLFTHRGISGPSILQISSYWTEGKPIEINLAPANDVFDYLKQKKANEPRLEVHNALAEILPRRLAIRLCETQKCAGRISELADKKLNLLADAINKWTIYPSGTEGYRTAEVTLGGVDTDEISSKTMEVKKHKGLYFIGEAVDVTGWLGGYNFQWAWSSGWVAGQHA